ncbi:DsbA family protein [Pseudonocardia broussonetiae]|uniref:Thioredoxin domain-containing protein n=1 Tax=Pseudonocardia broussonetiae TaxID=2736640 RepID=A0A6M6JKU7_9PSEU|nr:thioredoxin domain-containing protein [Pseudonocardia broussonetiae]QJY47875.1 thioredoxin domain-containing protein [Pseudonocardia broussonetiae]
MTKNLRATLTVVLVVLAVLVGALLLTRNDTAVPDFAGGPPAAQLVPDEVLVRADSHLLSTPSESRATFVEFLDFECESCRAAFPAVEQLRAEYGDRVTFVARYFPIPSHANAKNSAVAVEAAARQGRFEDMYRTMFETQAQWGEQQESQAALFRQFAVDLGLDLVAYDQAVSDPTTLERVLRDRADGELAGVQGTPTFFLDGARLEPESVDDLRAQLDLALAR